MLPDAHEGFIIFSNQEQKMQECGAAWCCGAKTLGVKGEDDIPVSLGDAGPLSQKSVLRMGASLTRPVRPLGTL